MESMKNLMPETDMQELWELNGRVKAVLAALENDVYLQEKPLIAMLGGVTAVEPGGDRDGQD